MVFKENLMFSNVFGSVTTKRISLNYKNGTEDLPIDHVTSISYKHKRNFIIAIGSCIVSIGAIISLFNHTGAVDFGDGAFIIMVFLLSLLISISCWIGHHDIIISVAGKNRKPIRVMMSKTKEGREFVEAVKKSVVK